MSEELTLDTPQLSVYSRGMNMSDNRYDAPHRSMVRVIAKGEKAVKQFLSPSSSSPNNRLCDLHSIESCENCFYLIAKDFILSPFSTSSSSPPSSSSDFPVFMAYSVEVPSFCFGLDDYSSYNVALCVKGTRPSSSLRFKELGPMLNIQSHPLSQTDRVSVSFFFPISGKELEELRGGNRNLASFLSVPCQKSDFSSRASPSSSSSDSRQYSLCFRRNQLIVDSMKWEWRIGEERKHYSMLKNGAEVTVKQTRFNEIDVHLCSSSSDAQSESEIVSVPFPLPVSSNHCTVQISIKNPMIRVIASVHTALFSPSSNSFSHLTNSSSSSTNHRLPLLTSITINPFPMTLHPTPTPLLFPLFSSSYSPSLLLPVGANLSKKYLNVLLGGMCSMIEKGEMKNGNEETLPPFTAFKHSVQQMMMQCYPSSCSFSASSGPFRVFGLCVEGGGGVNVVICVRGLRLIPSLLFCN